MNMYIRSEEVPTGGILHWIRLHEIKSQFSPHESGQDEKSSTESKKTGKPKGDISAESDRQSPISVSVLCATTYCHEGRLATDRGS